MVWGHYLILSLVPEDPGSHCVNNLICEFQQLDAAYTKSQQGTGLGLSSTKRLVEAQGETVGVHSVLGRDIISSAELPQRHLRGAEESGYAAFALTSPTGRAFVFMQDIGQANHVKRLLQKAGFEVESVQSVSEAHDRVTAHQYQALEPRSEQR